MEGAATEQDASNGESDLGVYLGFLECVERGRGTSAASRFLAPGFIEHRVTGHLGGDELLEDLTTRRTQFPNDEWTIDLLVNVGALIVCLATTSCLSPSGRSVRARETVISRVVDGMLAESWRVCDEPPRYT